MDYSCFTSSNLNGPRLTNKNCGQFGGRDSIRQGQYSDRVHISQFMYLAYLFVSKCTSKCPASQDQGDSCQEGEEGGQQEAPILPGHIQT